MTQERLIKKYANRRLYDATQSRHITLDDIRSLIVKGEKIKVVEDKTGHDITRHILLQVIAEQEQFGRPILSTPVLEAIIRVYGNAMQGFLAGFLEKSVETFLSQQEAVQAQISKIVANTPLATVADMTRQNLESLAKLQEGMLNALLSKRDKGRDEDDKKQPPSGLRRNRPRQLPREHRPLAFDAPPIASERAVGPQHVVARDEPRDRVRADGPADRSRRGRPPDLPRDVGIIYRQVAGPSQQRLPDLDLEVAAVHPQPQRLPSTRQRAPDSPSDFIGRTLVETKLCGAPVAPELVPAVDTPGCVHEAEKRDPLVGGCDERRAEGRRSRGVTKRDSRST